MYALSTYYIDIRHSATNDLQYENQDDNDEAYFWSRALVGLIYLKEIYLFDRSSYKFKNRYKLEISYRWKW